MTEQPAYHSAEVFVVAVAAAAVVVAAAGASSAQGLPCVAGNSQTFCQRPNAP